MKRHALSFDPVFRIFLDTHLLPRGVTEAGQSIVVAFVFWPMCISCVDCFSLVASEVLS